LLIELVYDGSLPQNEPAHPRGRPLYSCRLLEIGRRASSDRPDKTRPKVALRKGPLADVPSVANRANDPRRISSDKSIRGNVLGDYRTCRDDRILAYCYASDDSRAGCDPDAFLNHDGLSDCGGASLRGFKGMARRDDAHVRPDHHIVFDVEAAKVIESAVLIYEDIMPDADFGNAL
jgi:hypothetical protein